MKEALTFVNDPETLAAIERNGFVDPIPAQESPLGVWVYSWSLHQFYRWCMAQESRDEEAAERDENAPADESQH